MKEGLLTAAEAAIARRFHDAASGYRIANSAVETMIDPHWNTMVKEAGTLWRQLKECVTVDELEEMNRLESRFGSV